MAPPGTRGRYHGVNGLEEVVAPIPPLPRIALRLLPPTYQLRNALGSSTLAWLRAWLHHAAAVRLSLRCFVFSANLVLRMELRRELDEISLRCAQRAGACRGGFHVWVFKRLDQFARRLWDGYLAICRGL